MKTASFKKQFIFFLLTFSMIVQVFLGNGRMLKILVKGDLIGEIGFFSDRMTDYKAVTLNVASLAVLKKEDFLAVIRGFPADFVNYFYFLFILSFFVK